MDKRTIKVITVGNDLAVKGGITSVITQILNHNWNEENIQMKYISSFSDGNSINKIWDFISAYIQLLFQFVVNKPDVVHMHMSHSGSFLRKFFFHKLCKIFNIADVIHLHSSEFMNFYNNSNPKNKERIRELFTNSNCVIVLGSEWKKRVENIAPNANIEVLNNTVMIPNTKVKQNVERINFLYLGVLVKRKGVMDLLEAVRSLKEDYYVESTQACFNICGSGDCEQELKEFVDSNNLTEYVKFHGWVNSNDKNAYLSSNQVMILPSYNEGLPIAILEAISYGMPIIATDVGSVSEAVHNEVNGLLFQAGDINALTASIHRLLLSESLRVKYGTESKRIAESTFSDNAYFDKIREIYKKLSCI